MPIFDALYILFLLLTLPLIIRLFFKKEYRQVLKHRLTPGIVYNKPGRIWIHAVSVGEVKSVKSLVQRLSKEYNREIVLSVTTPSGVAFAREEYRDMDVMVINAPLDFSFTIKKFINAINPGILLLNELEIWPNWILKTKQAGIPILLINGRISDSAFQKYQRFSFFFKTFMKKIDRYLVQADLYKEKFTSLGIAPGNIMVCGNIKADTAAQAAEQLPQDKEILNHLKLSLSIKEEAKPVVTFASTHRSDEEIFLPILKQLKGKYHIIIVPRHLNRLEEIENRLQENSLAYARWSNRNAADSTINLDQEIMLFDRMGYLFNILKISDIVFMGGTFDSKVGGHSLYEPAALGKIVVGGPCYNNFPDIGKEMEEDGVYHTVAGTNQLASFFKEAGNLNFQKISEKSLAVVARRRGSIDRIIKQIQVTGFAK